MGSVILAVLLDVGGTLWPDRWPEPAGDEDPRVARLASAVPGLDHGRGMALAKLLAARATALDGALTQDTAGLVREAAGSLGLGLDAPAVAAIRRAMCLPVSDPNSLFSGTQVLLATIKAQGLRCVLVTNAVWRDGQAYRRDFEELGISGFIDAIISSVDIGFRKPHPAIFEAALAAAGSPAARCVMIGNSEAKDVQPALDLGMCVIRVAIEEPRPVISASHEVVTSLAEAALVLRQWRHAGRLS